MKTRKPRRPPERPTSPSGTPSPPLSDAVRALLTPNPDGRRRSKPPATKRHTDLPDPREGLLTPQEAADLHGVTTRTVYNWRQDGLIKPVHGPRGRIFYRLEDLLRLMDG